MATSLSKLKTQIERLQKRVTSIQTTVISRIKKEIAKHGLTTSDLFGGDEDVPAGGRATPAKTEASKPKKSGADKPAKFADDQGNSWHGVGKRPQWIHDALASGRSLSDFLIGAKGEAPTVANQISAKPAKKRAAAKKSTSGRKAASASSKAAPKQPAKAAKAAKAATAAPAKKTAKAAKTSATKKMGGKSEAPAKSAGNASAKKVPAKKSGPRMAAAKKSAGAEASASQAPGAAGSATQA